MFPKRERAWTNHPEEYTPTYVFIFFSPHPRQTPSERSLVLVEIKKLVINPVLFFILEGYAYISYVIKQTIL